ncbi:MAG: hypothetical protein GXC73_03195 [Chitinophagaceae bacterium]|nr:hypothetical protein [Chitinophagaceae bacterium]
MVEQVVHYLSFRKQISLQGIGTFSVEHLPARLDFPNRVLYAPEFVLHFSPLAKEHDEEFSQWLQSQLGIDAPTAKQTQLQFSENFQQSLAESGAATLQGIGVFTRDEQKNLQFSSLFETVSSTPVRAEKIIRKNTLHSVRVGEEEKTSEEMTELLTGTNRKPLNLWWVLAVALFLSALIAILYFANSSKQWGSQGNNRKLKLNEAPALHKIRTL